eukprot:Nk52_evm32s163 gene=Nk52_evmTU32s163
MSSMSSTTEKISVNDVNSVERASQYIEKYTKRMNEVRDNPDRKAKLETLVRNLEKRRRDLISLSKKRQRTPDEGKSGKRKSEFVRKPISPSEILQVSAAKAAKNKKEIEVEDDTIRVMIKFGVHVVSETERKEVFSENETVLSAAYAESLNLRELRGENQLFAELCPPNIDFSEEGGEDFSGFFEKVIEFLPQKMKKLRWALQCAKRVLVSILEDDRNECTRKYTSKDMPITVEAPRQTDPDGRGKQKKRQVQTWMPVFPIPPRKSFYHSVLGAFSCNSGKAYNAKASKCPSAINLLGAKLASKRIGDNFRLHSESDGTSTSFDEQAHERTDSISLSMVNHVYGNGNYFAVLDDI